MRTAFYTSPTPARTPLVPHKHRGDTGELSKLMWLMQAFWSLGLYFFRWGILELCDIANSLLSNKKNRDEVDAKASHLHAIFVTSLTFGGNDL